MADAAQRPAEFVHLRVHSAFSLLEGALQPDEIADLCKRYRMPAVAVTDTNNLFGTIDLNDALTKAGVQPIVGIQLALSTENAEQQRARMLTGGGRMADGVIVLLAQTEAGYANLMKLTSKGFLEVKPGEPPHVTLETLAQYSQGLIALTGGPKGVVNKLLVAGQHDAAAALFARLKTMFGDRLYVELQRHGLADEVTAEEPLVALAYKHDVPLVATNEPYFATRDLFAAHDALLCIAEGSYVTQENRRRESPEHYFKSADEMIELFADVPEAIASTIEIARRCAYRPQKRNPILPNFVPDSGLTPEEELRVQSKIGLEARLKLHGITDAAEHWKRLEFELDIIIRMKFAGYFLIVSDFMKWTRGQGIPVGVRGSGAGSVVAWALEITALEPLTLALAPQEEEDWGE